MTSSPSKRPARLRLVAVRAGYGRRRPSVVEYADLFLHPGESVALMGPSGAGKSTLLAVAAGLRRPLSGKVLIDHVDLSSLSERRRTVLRRERIGFVSQDRTLLEAFTAAENVALPLLLSRRRVERGRVLEALDRVGLADKGATPPALLSGGERQRVAIARAILSKPSLVVADEPTAALDEESASAVLDALQALTDSGSSLLLSTHDARNAARADRVVEIDHGHLRTARPPTPLAAPVAPTPPTAPRPPTSSQRSVG